MALSEKETNDEIQITFCGGCILTCTEHLYRTGVHIQYNCIMLAYATLTRQAPLHSLMQS